MTDPTADPTEGALRHMIAALAAERQALAGLDVAALVACAADTAAAVERVGRPAGLSDTARALATEAKRLNDGNLATVRLLSANVAARLDALTGRSAVYSPAPRAAVPA